MDNDLESAHLARVRAAVDEVKRQNPNADERTLLGLVMRALRGKCNPAEALRFIRGEE